jgi:hypothetical protein
LALTVRSVRQGQPTPLVRPIPATGQANKRCPGCPRVFKPKNSEEHRWKVNTNDAHNRNIKPEPMFPQLLNRYVGQASGLENLPREI